MADKKKKKSVKKEFTVNEITYRILGIPVFSKTITVDEDLLYKKMESRFERAMSNALDKKLPVNNNAG